MISFLVLCLSLLLSCIEMSRGFIIRVGSSVGRCKIGKISQKYLSSLSQDYFDSINQFDICNAKCTFVKCNSSEELHENVQSCSKQQTLGEIAQQEIESIDLTKYSNRRLSTYLGGRIAIKRSLSTWQSDLISFPILKNALGAPMLPPGYIGSISHKDEYAVGAVKLSTEGHLGVDIERTSNKASTRLIERILTLNEQATLCSETDANCCPSAGILSREEDIMLRFSFKESIYKALNPTVQRYIDFLEVEVFPQYELGTATIHIKLKDQPLHNHIQQQPIHYQANWQFVENRKYIISCVYIVI